MVKQFLNGATMPAICNLHTLLDRIRDLEESLRSLDKIERTGAAPWHSERTVRTTIYALADLRRCLENSEKKLRSDSG